MAVKAAVFGIRSRVAGVWLSVFGTRFSRLHHRGGSQESPHGEFFYDDSSRRRVSMWFMTVKEALHHIIILAG